MADKTPCTCNPQDACGCTPGRTGIDEVQRVATYLQNDEVIYTATQIFDALSDYTRFRILGALATSDLSVSELVALCAVSQSAISHQLRLLRDRGLVTMRREGQRAIYSLADDHVATLIAVGLEHAGHWGVED